MPFLSHGNGICFLSSSREHSFDYYFVLFLHLLLVLCIFFVPLHHKKTIYLKNSNFMKKAFYLLLALVLATAFAQRVNAQTTDHKETLNINVTTPGTLGDLVLAQTENFSDVKNLTLSGRLNDDDFYTLSKRMTSVVTLDMLNVDNETMPESCFYENKVLTSIVLPKKLLVISNSMFFRCDNLSSITFPPNLRKIGRSAMTECIGLTSLVLPETVDTLEDYSLQGCENISYVKLPARMKYWGDEIFYNWDKLETITIPEGITEIRHYTFYGCDALKSIVIPSWVTNIGDHAFHYCKKLENVTLSEGLIDLDGEAFSLCESLAEIDLPSTLRMVSTAFYQCRNLKTIRCHAINPPSASTYHSNGGSLSESATIYVPAVSLTTYKQTKAWDSHTILPLDEMPATLAFYSDMELNLPATLPAGYKPNMLLGLNYDVNGAYGWNAKYYQYYPAVTINGNTMLSLSDFHAEYDARDVESSNSYSSFYPAKLRSCIINNAPIRSDKVSLTFKLTYYAGGVWQFISLPFNARVSEMELAEGSDFVIYGYSGANRAAADFDNTWQRIPNDGILQAGKGYIIKCSNRDEIATFHAINDDHKNDIFRQTEAVVPLEEYTSDYSHNRSWNFIGNPYSAYFDTRLMQYDAPFVVWDIRNRQYRTYTPYDDDYVLSPGEGFFLQRPLNQASVAFPLEGRQGSKEVVERTTSRSLTAAADRTVYNLTLSSADGLTDRTRLVLNPQATTAFDYGRDATKFASIDPQVPQFYTLAAGISYSINERPVGDGIVSLGFKVAAAGDYTISLVPTQKGEPLTLVDHATGMRTLLTDGEGYTFHAETGTFDSRFTLEVGNAVTDIKNVYDNDNGNEIYDLQGRRMDNSSTFTLPSSLKKGIYIQGGKKYIVK